MDLHSFNSQAETFKSSSHTEPCCVITYHHPQYQAECSVRWDNRYASIIVGNCDCPGELVYYALSVSKPCFEPDSFLSPLTIVTLTSLNSRQTPPPALEMSQTMGTMCPHKRVIQTTSLQTMREILMTVAQRIMRGIPTRSSQTTVTSLTVWQSFENSYCIQSTGVLIYYQS